MDDLPQPKPPDSGFTVSLIGGPLDGFSLKASAGNRVLIMKTSMTSKTGNYAVYGRVGLHRFIYQRVMPESELQAKRLTGEL